MAWRERHHCLPSGEKGSAATIFLILPKAQTLEEESSVDTDTFTLLENCKSPSSSFCRMEVNQ